MSTPPFDEEGIKETESIPDGSGSDTGTGIDAPEGDASDTTSSGAPGESDMFAVPNK